MGKKHKHPEHENLERWLVSYADFITLLFATFVVLYALSQADLAKFKQAGESIKQAFSNSPRGVMDSSDGVLDGKTDPKILPDSGNSVLDHFAPKPAPTPPSTQGSMNPVAESVKEINQEIKKMMAEGGGKGGAAAELGSGTTAQLKLQERGIVISLNSNLFFEPGSAGIKPASFGVLDKIATELKPMDRVIHVEGHTDNQPIFTAVYPSNWELSSSRASSVVRYFTRKHHFDPTTLAAVGYAETRPLGDNKTAAGRAKNRRVDIVILFSSAVQQADAGEAQKSESVIVLSEESDPGQTSKKVAPTPKAPASAPPMMKAAPPKPQPKTTSQKPQPQQKEKANLTQEFDDDIEKVVVSDAEKAGLKPPVQAAKPALPRPRSSAKVVMEAEDLTSRPLPRKTTQH